MTTITLNQARQYVSANMSDGVKCPCCAQFAKRYRRKINSSMARALIAMVRTSGQNEFHLPSLVGYGGDPAKLAHWRLIQELGGGREDGGKHNGWWRVTADGARFVYGALRVPKYALLYDGQLLGFEGEPVSIHDALGTRFDYSELMRGV